MVRGESNDAILTPQRYNVTCFLKTTGAAFKSSLNPLTDCFTPFFKKGCRLCCLISLNDPQMNQQVLCQVSRSATPHQPPCILKCSTKEAGAFVLQQMSTTFYLQAKKT